MWPSTYNNLNLRNKLSYTRKLHDSACEDVDLPPKVFHSLRVSVAALQAVGLKRSALLSSLSLASSFFYNEIKCSSNKLTIMSCLRRSNKRFEDCCLFQVSLLPRQGVQRVTRIMLRDLLVCMEQDHFLRCSLTHYRAMLWVDPPRFYWDREKRPRVWICFFCTFF